MSHKRHRQLAILGALFLTSSYCALSSRTLASGDPLPPQRAPETGSTEAPGPPPRAADIPTRAGRRAIATRLDIALELIKLERALAAARVDGRLSAAETKRVNQSFDTLTGLFFAGRNAEAIDRLQQLRDTLSLPPRTELGRAVDALKPEIEPALLVLGEGAPIGVRIRPLHAAGDRSNAELGGGERTIAVLSGRTLRVMLTPVPAPGQQSTGASVELCSVVIPDLGIKAAQEAGQEGMISVKPPSGGLRIEREISGEAAAAIYDALKPGAYSIDLQLAGETVAAPIAVKRADVGRVQVVAEPLDSFAARAQTALAAVDSSRIVPLALATVQSRIDLASRSPRPADAGRSMLSLASLQRDVQAEIASMASARVIGPAADPYFNRTGLWQLTLGPDAADVPVWLYGPPIKSGSTSGSALGSTPGLLIALHGAGGDEAMFPLSYGAGEILSLCAQYNLVLASPRTEPLMSGPGIVDALIARASVHYNIDSRRIFVIGHSMGAITVASLATQRSYTIAAAVCIAGGPVATTPPARSSPLLVLAAELDGILPAARLAPVVERWAAAGRDVTFRTLADTGHTLCVGPALGDAVKWLSERPFSIPALEDEKANP